MHHQSWRRGRVWKLTDRWTPRTRPPDPSENHRTVLHKLPHASSTFPFQKNPRPEPPDSVGSATHRFCGGGQGETDEDLDPSLSEQSWREALTIAEKLGEARSGPIALRANSDSLPSFKATSTAVSSSSDRRSRSPSRTEMSRRWSAGSRCLGTVTRNWDARSRPSTSTTAR